MKLINAELNAFKAVFAEGCADNMQKMYVLLTLLVPFMAIVAFLGHHLK